MFSTQINIIVREMLHTVAKRLLNHFVNAFKYPMEFWDTVTY